VSDTSPEPDAPTTEPVEPVEPVESFGDERVDEAVAGLSGLDQHAVHEHPEQYERAHDALRAALDDEPTSAPRSDTGSA